MMGMGWGMMWIGMGMGMERFGVWQYCTGKIAGFFTPPHWWLMYFTR